MQNNLEDQSNLNPEYQFILNNLSILTTDISLTNIKTKFPERQKCGIAQNQRLINLKRQIVRDVSEDINEFIYFNAYQWQTIVDTIKNKQTENAI